LVLHFAAAKRDSDLNFVVVFEELACLSGLGVHVVVIRFRPKANLLQLLLANFAGLVSLLRGREPQFAIIEDSANRRSLVGCYLDQVQASLPRFLKSLKSRHNAQLFPLGADQTDRADADLFVLTRAAFLRTLTIKMSNTRSPEEVKRPPPSLNLGCGPVIVNPPSDCEGGRACEPAVCVLYRQTAAPATPTQITFRGTLLAKVQMGQIRKQVNYRIERQGEYDALWQQRLADVFHSFARPRAAAQPSRPVCAAPPRLEMFALLRLG
jgi:hypothetical protein